MMAKITEIEIENFDGQIQSHIIIDYGNEQFTSMLKSTYDAQQAALIDSEDE